MTNVYTLKDINNKGDGSFKGVGQRLGGAYEQELKEKLYSALKSKAEINDLNEKLVDKYNEREKEFQRTYADVSNKISQANESCTKVRSRIISERKAHSERQREHEAERAKYTAEIQSLKSENKTLKRKTTLVQKASSLDKDTILSLEAKVRELEDKSSDPKEIDSLRLELERAKEDLNSKNHEIECMEKGIEATHELTSQEIDALRKARLNSIEENRLLRNQISKKEPRGASHNEIADLSNPPLPSMNDSSQKLPGWVSDDLRPLVYERGLEDKVMELDKSFAREHILEALQELLPQNEIVSRSQTDTLPNQSVYSRPTHSEKFISREGIAKQLGGAEAVSLPATAPIITSSLMSPTLLYSILAIVLIAIIWFMARKWWISWKKSNQNFTYENYINRNHAKRLLARPDHYYFQS
ncbi:unnamed protein product [Rhizophagus irregularis]|nr:unnamed protein product [Rhizophagus irregularis]